jgi:NarL family two-component system response regulator LiaR
VTELIRVQLVEDHQMFADALKVLIDAAEGLAWAGTAGTGEEAVQLGADARPDVVLMDIDLPGIDGIEATRRLLEVCPEARVVAITALQPDQVMAGVIEAGACGFVPKTQAADQLIDVIRAAAAGEIVLPAGDLIKTLARLREAREARKDEERLLERLTERELEILQALAEGNSVPEIAGTLFISPHTVNSHVRNILTKLGVHSKLEAVLMALRQGIIRTSRAS